MGDSFTNVLLIVLISLIGFIGKVSYQKLNEVFDKIERILMSDVGREKDIKRLQDDIEDHEKRIDNIENKL